MLDKLGEIRASSQEQPRAYWFQRIDEKAETPRERTTRLTIWIDRSDLSRTTSALFAPTRDPTAEPPPNAWTAINPPQSPPAAPRRIRPI
jgi:hypothetical protein